MAFVEINPRYRDCLERQGLTAPEHFLEMPSVIICGHPDRNVARVALGTGAGALPAFLKREHRVPWRERLCNAVAGFGFVSRSGREAAVLRAVQQAGIGCPDWMAVGEDGQGRAFLLLRELSGTRELRLFLQDQRTAPADQRRRFARRLGEGLAGVHNAGFDHPDLYSKHVLVNPGDETISFLDWQRSRRACQVGWRRRWRDLAALQATLAEGLATARERLVCLRAYLRKCRTYEGKCETRLRRSLISIRRRAGQLLRQRRIRELCRVPAATGTQALIRQDGEALCLTPEFQADLGGRIPDWLVLANLPPQPRSLETRTWVDLPAGRRALLVRRRESRLTSGMWAFLQRRPPAPPELRQAGLLFRLERYGIRGPRLLAFGQRAVSRWRVESFLLTEPPRGAVGLSGWLARHSACHPGAPGLGQRRHSLREAAGMLRRLHNLNCYLGGQRRFDSRSTEGKSASFVVVQQDSKGTPDVVLAGIDCLRARRRPSEKEALKDLVALRSELSSAACGRTDELRFLLSYLGLRNLTAAAKRLARSVPRSRGPTGVLRVGDVSQPVGSVRLRTAEQGALP